MVSPQVKEAARLIEHLTGVPPGGSIPEQRREMGREKREQTARVKRFLALPPQLQEGVLRYGENIRGAYRL